jgi:hypothetical protein
MLSVAGPATCVNCRRLARRRLLNLYLVVRWLAPWAVALAMSTVIAHTAAALFVSSNTVEVSASYPARPMPEQTLAAPEPDGVLTRVACPGDVDRTEREVLLTNLQDLQMLEEGQCEMRP